MQVTDANWGAHGPLQETIGLIVQIYTTEADLSTFDKIASPSYSLFFCTPVDLELTHTAVCGAPRQPDCFHTSWHVSSACWDGACWHPYWGIISVCPPWHAGTAWTSLVSFFFHTSSPLLWPPSLGLGYSSIHSHHVLHLLLFVPDSDLSVISDPACKHQPDMAVD